MQPTPTKTSISFLVEQAVTTIPMLNGVAVGKLEVQSAINAFPSIKNSIKSKLEVLTEHNQNIAAIMFMGTEDMVKALMIHETLNMRTPNEFNSNMRRHVQNGFSPAGKSNPTPFGLLALPGSTILVVTKRKNTKLDNQTISEYVQRLPLYIKAMDNIDTKKT